MKRILLITLLLASLQPVLWAQVFDLRCEGLKEPLGVDTTVPRFSWKNTLKHNGQRQKAYEIQVASDSAALVQGHADLWQSGRVRSEAQVWVEYQGKKLLPRQLCYWRVRTWDEHDRCSGWSPIHRFAIGPLDGIKGAYIGHSHDRSTLAPTPYFFKSFNVNLQKGNPVFIHINSLGYHTLYVNDSKVGDAVLQPAVSQLDKHSYIVTYDITPYLEEGNNDVMILCGQGWNRQTVFDIPFDGPLLKAEICQWVDGQWQAVDSTDRWWDAWTTEFSYTGTWLPLQFGGEQCDGTLPYPRDFCRKALFDVKGMQATPQNFEGNHIIDTLLPQSITYQSDSSLLLDFGRAITGWISLRFDRMERGNRVVIEYSDHLDENGNFFPQGESDLLIAEGPRTPTWAISTTADSLEHFHNRFHHHAFRYVRISGAGVNKAKALQISALNPKEASTFRCSDDRLNQIHDLVQYTLQCLTFSGYMVDCPHLERMGYGGDGNSSTMTLQTMYDVLPTYRNWLRAWAESMDEDGGLAYVAPAFPTGGGPYWSGFIIKAPWRTYLNYGDLQMVETYYDYGKRWLGYVEQYCVDGLLQPWPDTKKRMWFLGDWLAPKGVDLGGESILHVNNCFLSECYGDMEKMAHLLGKNADAQNFAERKAQIQTAIQQRFYHPETRTYANGTPIDQAYALLVGVPQDAAIIRQVTEQLLKDSYGKYNAHIAVGLMGVPIFTEWCVRERQTELMATILRQPDYPGYLDMIHHGATATWESWDGERSRIHNCYNGIGTWFYQAVAGIRPDENAPGYRHFFIDPQPVDDVEWVEATKPTYYGEIRVKLSAKKMELTIPVGTTATVFPGTDRERTLPAGKWHLKRAQ